MASTRNSILHGATSALTFSKAGGDSSLGLLFVHTRVDAFPDTDTDCQRARVHSNCRCTLPSSSGAGKCWYCGPLYERDAGVAIQWEGTSVAPAWQLPRYWHSSPVI